VDNRLQELLAKRPLEIPARERSLLGDFKQFMDLCGESISICHHPQPLKDIREAYITRFEAASVDSIKKKIADASRGEGDLPQYEKRIALRYRQTLETLQYLLENRLATISELERLPGGPFKSKSLAQFLAIKKKDEIAYNENFIEDTRDLLLGWKANASANT
jgi:hypothetical protein